MIAVELTAGGQRVDEGERGAGALHHGDRGGAVQRHDGGGLQALDRKIPWSLSNDVETEIPSDFFTQMRTNFFLQRMQIFTRERAKESNVPPLLTVKDIVHVATAGGARANWLDKRTGSLTPGKEADVILLTANAINVTPLNHAYGAIVLGMDTSNVDTVFVGGRVKKWQGRRGPRSASHPLRAVAGLSTRADEMAAHRPGWLSARALSSRREPARPCPLVALALRLPHDSGRRGA